MVIGDKADYELNYVYTPVKVSEFRSVNVVLKILNNKVKLVIRSEEEIEPEDLSSIVKNLQKEIFSKIGMDIKTECSIYLFVKDEEHYIDYGKEMRVYKLKYEF